MKYLLQLVILLSLFGPVTCQTPAYSWANGLSLRAEPSKKSAALAKILHGEQVEIIDTLNQTMTDTLEKGLEPLVVTGNWLKVSYKGKTGFVFGGYISLLKPQRPDEFFARYPPIKADPATAKAQKWPVLLEIYKTPNGSEHTWVAEGEGCWSHLFLFKELTFNDVLMLINEENKAYQCSFGLKKMEDNTYYFGACDATSLRNLTVIQGGIMYQTEDCD